MFGKSFKSALAIAVVAASAIFATAGNADAGGGFSLHIGNGYGGGIHIGNGYHGGYKHHGYGGHYGHKKFHGHAGHKRFCHPRRALKKAWHLGVNRPHIKRVNRKKIVVVGYNHGHRAKVVFARKSPRCHVIKARGLY